MVDTRRFKANIVLVMKPEDLTTKINSSKINSATKELLKLFMTMFLTLKLEHDTKIKTIDNKVVDLDNKYKALQDEVNDVKHTTKIRFLLWRDEYPHSRQKTNLKKIITFPTSTHLGESLTQTSNMKGVIVQLMDDTPGLIC